MAESDGSPGENPPVSTQNVAGGIGEGREDTSDPVASTSGSAPGVGSAGGEHHSQLVNSQLVSVPVVVVPCVVAPVGLTDSSVGGQFGMTRQAVLATVTAQAQMQLEVGDTQTSNSYQQQISSAHSSTPIRKSSVANLEVNVIPSKLQKPSASNHKALSPHIVVKTTSSDGYNWRKYGQKQVKSSENSRSYFRCTYANCFAKKKVEHCHDGRVVEVIYRGEHNHDPPQKLKYSKECFFEHNGKGKRNLNNQRMEFDASDYYTKQSEKDTCNGASEQLHCSSDCEQDLRVNTEGDNGNELASKPRVFENRTTYLAPVFKTVRKPKMVVQSACELGKINDGYKWRKYGQKIVKGNPNPRSYYKCTNAGCPVRKHVEKASKDARSVIITYEGQHNHDLPTSKQHNETLTRAPATRSPADALYTSVVSTSGKQVQSSNCVLDTESPAGDAPVRDGESMVGTEMDLAGEMALESAETLLSIRCKTTSEDGDKANNPDVIQCPLFDQARPVVPV